MTIPSSRGFRSLVILPAVFLSLLLPQTSRAQEQTPPPPAVPHSPRIDPRNVPLPGLATMGAPVTPLSWDKLLAPYAADTPPTDMKEEIRSDPDLLRVHLTFTDAQGAKVTGLFLRPKEAGLYPVILLLHGLGSDKESLTETVGKELAKQGFASLALDADQHGERKSAGKQAPMNGMAFGSVVRMTVPEYRQALSYLTHRTDVDDRRIGLLGYSMGAMMGAILGGVDPRIHAVVLCVGGDPVVGMTASVPAPMQPLVQTISPSNYVSHISPRPVYFVNGTKDQVMSEAASKLLQEKAGEPKTIKWVDSGHLLPAQAVREGVVWLTDKLKIAVPATAPKAP